MSGECSALQVVAACEDGRLLAYDPRSSKPAWSLVLSQCGAQALGEGVSCLSVGGRGAEEVLVVGGSMGE